MGKHTCKGRKFFRIYSTYTVKLSPQYITFNVYSSKKKSHSMSITFNPSFFFFLAAPKFFLEEHIRPKGMCSLASVSGKTLGVASYYGVEVTARLEINGKKIRFLDKNFPTPGRKMEPHELRNQTDMVKDGLAF